MPKPSAPMLQAEYHTMESNSFNDYYGGYEPKASQWAAPGAPYRMEINNQTPVRKSRCHRRSVCCISFVVFCRSALILFFCGLLYTHGYQNDLVSFIGVYEMANIIGSVLMCCGLSHKQPFFCILFTVLRTMETFSVGVFGVSLGYAIYDRNSEPARYIRGSLKSLVHEYDRRINVNLEDLSMSLTLAAFLVTLFLFAVCLWVCRLSWQSTLWITDERKKKLSVPDQAPRVMVASDELYTNY